MTFNNTTVPNSLYGRSISGTSTVPFVDVFMDRDPTVNDVNYSIQQKWLNTIDNTLWVLKNFSSLGGFVTADWIEIGGLMKYIAELTGNTGGPVGPSAITNNVNILGDGTTITVTGSPSTNTLTISALGDVSTSFVGNAGTATPLAGVINIVGIQGIETACSSNDIDIIGIPAKDSLVSSILNVGVASFNTNQFSVDANGYVSATNEVATEYATQSGLAVPASGILNIVGSSGIATSASGSTVTITASGSFSIVNNQIFASSGTYTPTAGMIYCNIQCVGGGGGGSGTVAVDAGHVICGGGGGGGEYAVGVFSAADIGVSQVITIGAGGTAGPAGGNFGGAGGTTSVGAIITANGGSGGNPGATSISGTFSVPAAGGAGGAGGDYRCNGNCSTVGTVINGTNCVIGGGGGGGPFGGATAGGSNGASLYPYFAGGYGVGGSAQGAGPSQPGYAGQAGFDGVVIITEYIG